MIDQTAGRPNPPDALWVSTWRETFLVVLDHRGHVEQAPPIARRYLGQHFGVVYRRALARGRGTRFAWVYPDGQVGEEWE